MKRRTLLRAGGGLAVLGATGGLGWVAATGRSGQTGTVLRSAVPLPEPFTQPLALPATLNGTTLVQRAADVEILPGRSTRVIGYNGTFPGPTIRGSRGKPLTLSVRSELPVNTVVHLHGGVTPPESDGYPTDYIKPGATREYTYPFEQPAATLWYHDHAMDFTGPNVYGGLAGFLLLSDHDEQNLPLPTGDRDLPLMICDRAFDADAQFSYPALSPEQRYPGIRGSFLGGVLGDVVLVNGVPWPEHPVDAARYRIRLLNASNARRYELALDPPPPQGPAFTQIGSDAGLLEGPLPRESVTLAPAERVEAIVDFSGYPPGTRVVVRNRLGSGSTESVMRFVVARRAHDDTAIPARLNTFEPLGDPVAVRTFHFALDFPTGGDSHGMHTGPGMPNHRWTINGRQFDLQSDIAAPRLGDVEVWRFMTDVHHPVHLHLAHFRVMRRNGRTPLAGDSGLKDTVDLLPGETCEVVTRFSGYRGRYVLHCHNLEHEDMAMMANFSVV